MTDAANLLRRAADTVEQSVVSVHAERVISLLALHIIRSCGTPAHQDEAKILLALLEEE